MSPSIWIREVRQEDFAQWSTLWDGYNEFYERVGPNALPPELTRATWLRFFDPHERMYALVAEREGRLLGLTHFLYHRSTSELTFTCYLQDLFTVDTARGEGVGGALIATVYERAAAAGAGRVYWLTHETNAVARRLYDRLAVRTGFLHYRKLL